jgi:hypothetical protein
MEVKVELVRVLERRMYAAQQMQRRIFLAKGYVPVECNQNVVQA